MRTTPPPSSSSTATTGFSLSPGGLLLPYFTGVLESLEYEGQLTPYSPLAGSSAGSIAVTAHSCGINGAKVLDATVQISEECASLGGARGRLLPRLREQLNTLITDETFYNFQTRPSSTTIAYRELLPRPRSIHANTFETKEELINAVCYSSMFPFFSTNWPMTICTANTIPRLVVDGYFAVPRDRFGCPDFDRANVDVDRTIMVSCFPREKIKLNACEPQDCIAPPETDRIDELFRYATESSSREELTKLYERGWKDAENWCKLEQEKQKQKENLNGDTNQQNEIEMLDLNGDVIGEISALN